MEFSGHLVLAAMSAVLFLAQMPAISGQTLSDDIAVTMTIERRWFGGFIGKFHLNFTEDADFWLFDVTFPRNLFDLKVSCIAAWLHYAWLFHAPSMLKRKSH